MSLLKTSAIDSDGSLQIKSAGNTRITLTTDGDIDLNGNLTGLTELSVDGNINASGYIFEKKTSFVPNQTGWWRVYEGTFFSGTLILDSGFDDVNVATKVSLMISASPYGQDSSVSLISKTGVNGGVVTKARISNNNGGAVYIDLYVQSTSTGTMNVYAYGPNISNNLVSSPTSGVSSGGTDEIQISWSDGFSSITPLSSTYWLSNPTTGVLGSKIHHDNGNLIFNNDFNTERMRITSGGNVRIGDISTAQEWPLMLTSKVDVNNANGRIGFVVGGTAPGAYVYNEIWNASENAGSYSELGLTVGNGGSGTLFSSIGCTFNDGFFLYTDGTNKQYAGTYLRTQITSAGEYRRGIQGATNNDLYPDFCARAWVNFNGTGTVAIRGSGNVSSITDNNTGDYTVNFTTAMPDTNYAAVGGGGSSTPAEQYLRPTTYSTGSFRFSTINSGDTAQDSEFTNIVIHR